MDYSTDSVNALSCRSVFVNPQASTSKPLDQSLVWQQLADKLERFIAAWDQGTTAPDWQAYLHDVTPSELRQTAIELIKIDLEYRWVKLQEPTYIEFYLQALPELQQPIPVDLLYEEYHLRQRVKHDKDARDLLQRFPEHAIELRKLIGTQSLKLQTTLMHGGKASPPIKIEPGERIDDFDLLAELGEGAFGKVYLAWQRSMQRQVALKVTAESGTESQTLAQLDHEHIVRVYDQRPVPNSGLRMMYMQYVAGGTLRDVIDRLTNKPPIERTGKDYLSAIDGYLRDKGLEVPQHSPLREYLAKLTWCELVCWIGARLARALDYAHQQGVLHRDIKPANVLLTFDGLPKLADFNISFSASLADTSADAQFGGSLAYMSPEQLRVFAKHAGYTPDQLDQRSDLYSLGMMLSELLTGERPFEKELLAQGTTATVQELLKLREQSYSATYWQPFIKPQTPGLDRVLRHCLEANHTQRVESGRDVERALGLCRLPATQALLQPPRTGWVDWVQRHPTLVVVLLCLLPNIIGGALNYTYNHAEIIQKMGNAEEVFFWVQAWINGTFFPLGVALGAWRIMGVTPYVWNQARREQLDEQQLAKVRTDALALGHHIALIGIVLWIIGGLAFPLAMHLGMGEAPVSMYLHFFASLLICGLIAAAYPFFVMSLFVLHCFLPQLIRHSRLLPSDAEALEILRKRSWVYFALAALVPMLAVMMLTLLEISSRWAPLVSTAGGMLGFAGAWLAVRRIQAEVEAYQVLALPELPQ
jgi:eukaryotic-like serine/threonine-protein kinase